MVTENLIFSVTEINVSTDEIATAPGDFMATDSSGNSCVIVSQGMLNVDIVGETSGDSYSFAGKNLEFGITIPCTGTDPANADSVIEMWYYDETSGLWIEEGTADKSFNTTTGNYEYVGKVSHFTTWNMDFKVANRTSVTGNIVDSEIRVYKFELKAPGFYRSLSESTHDLTIINLPPSTNFELIVSTDDIDGVQVTNFTTPADSTGGPLDLETIYDVDYPHFVDNLKISQNGQDFKVTWIDPTRAEYSGLSIKVGSDSSIPVVLGVEEFTITGVPEGTVDFVFQALYNDGNNSDTVTKQRISAISYTLTLGKVNDTSSLVPTATFDNITFYYYYDDLAYYVLYTGPVEIPAGVTLIIEARDDEITGKEVMYNWYKDGTYDEDGKTITKTMDGDKSLIAHCWLCG